jgi:hypothetical protein
MKVPIHLIKVLLFALFFLSGCDSKSSSNHYTGYNKFKCKGKTVTSYYPMKLYTFKNIYNKNFYSKMTSYSMDVVDCCTNLHSDSNINIVKVYPAFEKFKLLKYYIHCSFGNGCHENYLIRHEGGVISWLSGANFSSQTCQISGSDFWLDMEQNATDSYDAETIDQPYSQYPIKDYTIYHSYDKSKVFIERFIQQNNMKLEHKIGEDNLTIILPSKEIYQLSAFIYVEKVLKNFYPKNKKINMRLVFQNTPFPIFKYFKDKDIYFRTPFNCQQVDIDLPFECFKDFEKWLKKPYERNMTESIGNIKYDFKKNKLHLFAIFNYKFLDIGMYFNNMRYLKVLKDEGIKIYSADIGYKGFKKEGIYLVDNNFIITNELHFNKESVDKILNMKDSIEIIK